MSRFCGNLSSQREQLLLKLCNNLLHRHRHCSSSDRITFSSCVSRHTSSSSKHGPSENTKPQLSSTSQMSITQKESSNDRTLLHPGALRNVSRFVTNHHATMMKSYDYVSCAVDRFLEPFMRSVLSCHCRQKEKTEEKKKTQKEKNWKNSLQF